jgi:predicted transcriptional regulator
MDRGSELVKLIEQNPGIKFREIMRKTGMKNGVLSYHTMRLEENGNVKVERNTGETRFYPYLMTLEEAVLIKNLRQTTPQQILLSLLDKEKLSFVELVKKVNKSQSRVSTCLSQLIENKLVEYKVVDHKKIYQITNLVLVREMILRYHPVLLERTAFNLADIFSNL